MEITVSKKTILNDKVEHSYEFSIEKAQKEIVLNNIKDTAGIDIAAQNKPIQLDYKENNNAISIESVNQKIELNPKMALECGVEVKAISENYLGLAHKPSINGVILEGDKSSKELKIIEDKNFVFVSNEASDTWIIEHNLNKYPNVTVIDSAGEEVIGDVSYDNINQITIKFKNGGFKGTATLN